MPYNLCEIFVDSDELIAELLNNEDRLNYFHKFLWRKSDYKLSILCG